VDEALGEPTQQRIRSRCVAGGAADIEAEPHREVGALMHAICESGEYFATLVDSEANDQDTVLRLCEQLAQYNTNLSQNPRIGF
jgi:hypothetical protein